MIDDKDLFKRAAQRFDPPTDALERMLKRMDRRARMRRASAVAVALILVLATFGAAVTMFREQQRPEPATPIPIPFAPQGFRPAVLPLASIAYPSGWSLLDPYEEGRANEGPVLQLTNFDAGLEAIDCQSADFPAGGVALLVSETGPAAGDEPLWPVSLTPTEPEAGSGCPGALGATWQSSTGTGYTAQALVGEQASPDDRAALETAFESMLFPKHRPADISVLGTAPRLVLDTGMSGDDLVMLIASREADGVYLSVSGPIHSANPDTPTIYLASSRVRDGRTSDSPVNMGLDGGRPFPFSVAWGTVRPGVDHADIVNDDGEHFPVTFVPFPPSLGLPELAAWAFVQGPIGVANAVPYDAQGNELGSNWYPTAPADILATGEDPTGGPWVLTIAHSNIGDGLGFAWTSRGESGGGCCFSIFSDPRRHPLQLNGYSPGDPGSIEAIVSAEAASVVFESAGQTVDGLLVRLPDEYLGPAQVALVLVPVSLATQGGDGGLIGNLVAYDARGAQIARAFLGGPEPFVSTPEVGAVWQSLARAGDAISGYGAEHPLTELDAPTLSGLEPYVQWNLGTDVVPGQVTLGMESASPDIGGGVLLRAATSSGDAYCVAVLIDPQETANGWGGGKIHAVMVRYGHGDATTVAGCRGGWD